MFRCGKIGCPEKMDFYVEQMAPSDRIGATCDFQGKNEMRTLF